MTWAGWRPLGFGHGVAPVSFVPPVTGGAPWAVVADAAVVDDPAAVVDDPGVPWSDVAARRSTTFAILELPLGCRVDGQPDRIATATTMTPMMIGARRPR